MLLQKGDERLRLIVDSRRSFLVLHALLASERIGHLDHLSTALNWLRAKAVVP